MFLTKATRTLASGLVALTLLSGCASVQGLLPGGAAKPAETVDERLVQGDTRFAFDLFQVLRKEKPDKNLFISPASISLALSLTLNGARGETQAAMLKTLALDSIPLDEMNKANADLQTVLANPDKKVELSIANSIWFKQGFKVNPSFLKVTQDSYRAGAYPANFGAPEAAREINQWVSKSTREKIKTVVDRTEPLDRMYLINAIYFKGAWTKPFDPKQTRPAPFHTAGGTTKDIPMMNQSGEFRYLKGENFQAVRLPYGEGRTSMYVLLPDQGVAWEQFLRSLTADKWTQWAGSFATREGSLTLPKVKLEYEAELKPSLRALGMGIAFEPGKADFGNLLQGAESDLHIGFVLHKSFLDLNEEGTEAAAVTVVGVRTTSAPIQDTRFNMVVDRPFVMAIRDDTTGALLFLGSIVNPN